MGNPIPAHPKQTLSEIPDRQTDARTDQLVKALPSAHVQCSSPSALCSPIQQFAGRRYRSMNSYEETQV